MKKKNLSLLLALLLILMCVLPFSAQAADIVITDPTETTAPAEDSLIASPEETAENALISPQEDNSDLGVSRVVDRADIFSDSEEAEMAQKIAEFQKTYNADLLVITDTNDGGVGFTTRAIDLYQAGGYGMGADASGVVLFICMEAGNRGWYGGGTGSWESSFTRDTVNWLDDRLEPYMVNGQYGKGVLGYIDNLSKIHGGTVPKEWNFGKAALIGIVVGLVAGGISLLIQRAKMHTVAAATGASNYLVPGSLKLNEQNDIYMGSTVIRTKRVQQQRVGGSGGGSSFSSGSHGSSGGGGSFSGGGRRF